MGFYRRNITASFERYIWEHDPRKEKHDWRYLRSLLILFVLLAVILTIRETRNPPLTIDSEKETFIAHAEQRVEAEKANLWPANSTPEQLMAVGDWHTIEDYKGSDLEGVARKLLDKPGQVYDWDTLKMQEIDRLWQYWSAAQPKPDLDTFLTEELAKLTAEGNLPGIGKNVWLVISWDYDKYLLTIADGRWAICPVDDLK